MANEIAILGIDLGKNSGSVVGLDAGGAVIKRRRMRPLAMFTRHSENLAPKMAALSPSSL